MSVGNYQETLKKLRREYLKELPQTLEAIDKNWQSLQWAWHQDVLKKIYLDIHNITGNAANFGFDALSHAARILEPPLLELNKSGKAPGADQLSKLNEGFKALKQLAGELDREPGPEMPQTITEDNWKTPDYIRFHLVKEDCDMDAYFTIQINQIEANWQALQWEWHRDTVRHLYGQLRALRTNAKLFGITSIGDSAQSLEDDLLILGDMAEQPNSARLVNLSHQLPRLKQALADYQAELKAAARCFEPQHELIAPEDVSADENLDEIALYVHPEDKELPTYLLLQLKQAENAWQTLHWEWRPLVLQHLRNELEAVVKNARQFRFDAPLATLAKILNMLKQLKNRSPDLTQVETLNRLMEQLAAEIQQHSQSIGIDAVCSVQRKPVYLVDDDRMLAQLMAAQLSEKGYDIQVFTELDLLPAAVKQNPPSLMLMDIVMTGDELAGPRIMFKIQKDRSKPVPVIFMSSRTDMQARLAAVKARGNAYFTKPVNVEELCAKIDELTGGGEEEAPHILIVDNTGKQAAEYAKILQQESMEVRVLAEPLRFTEALDKIKPALVLLNAQLNKFSAVELAEVVRQQDKYESIPIIIYNQPFELTWRGAVMKGVGDDFLSDRVSPPQLLATVSNRLRMIKKVAKNNPKGDDHG